MKYTALLRKKFSENSVLIAAHQGLGGGNIVLNTPNAMLTAIKWGADILETDIARSRDGDFLIFHEDMEPRHLMVKEKISEMRTKQIRELDLWNNACIPSKFHVSTIEEMMDVLKRQDILINIDKCDLHGSDLLHKLDEFRMEEQFIIKGRAEKWFLDIVAAHTNPFMFVPVVTSEEELARALTYSSINTVGFELIFTDPEEKHVSKKRLEGLLQKGYFLWVNAITLGKKFCLSADIDDDLSILSDPDRGWGRLIDMGFNVIQTDWTPMLKKYLTDRELSTTGKYRI